MIKRDEYSIVVQHDKYDPSYGDQGDSAARTGILAACGSRPDQINLHKYPFVIRGLGRRHPYANSPMQYNSPENFTRDQLIQLTAGLPAFDAKELFYSHLKRGFLCQNSHTLEGDRKPFYQRDILTPSHIGHLIIKGRIKWAYPLLAVSWAWMFLDLVWSTKIKPESEQNQIICMMLTAGHFWPKLYKKMHKSWRQSLKDYWGQWRDQPEIADIIIKYLEAR